MRLLLKTAFLFSCLIFWAVKPVSAQKVPDKNDMVYTTVDNAPEPPGGNDGYAKYLEKHIKYPKKARKAHAEGTVYISMVVAKDGHLTDVTILKDNVGYGCGKEAAKVIKKMPAWKPGTINGQPVSVKYVVPVKFRL